MERGPKRKRAWHGETTCEREGCKNKAYWELGGSFLCGVHSPKGKKARVALPKNPDAAKIAADRYRAISERVRAERAANVSKGSRGKIACGKMYMMKGVPQVDGFLTVLPNFKHGNGKRNDGLGVSSLSPMSLGPVYHEEPGYPPSRNIENYHQFRKAFPCELDPDGNPLPSFVEAKKKAYNDPVPHRHKFDFAKMKEMAGPSGNKNIPAYSVHLMPNGEERRYDYVGSRYFYCHQYEILAGRTAELAQLRLLARNGTNLLICGYDGQEIEHGGDVEATAAALQKLYESPDKPFGHELVLFSLLTLYERPETYPWRVYAREHRDLYE
jgi:hypothetical protein